MRRSTFFAISAFALLGFTLISAPAQADTIKLPPDPFIGIRGGDGSESALDATPQPLSACTDTALLGFYCAAFHLEPGDLGSDYDENPVPLTSIGMIWWDVDGTGTPHRTEPGSSCNGLESTDNFCPAGPSDFHGISFGGEFGEGFDEYLVTLSVNPDFDDFPFGFDGTLHFVLFKDSPGWVSSQLLNGERNGNAEEFPGNENAFDLTGTTRVPEPATLLLLSIGVLGTALRGRLRRRR